MLMACSACEKAKQLANGVVNAVSQKLSSANYYIGIMNAYGAIYSPSAEQIELAKKRAEVCLNCEERREFGETDIKKEIVSFVNDNFASEQVKSLQTNYSSCSACGCPLFAKVFADVSNPALDCPLAKWTFENAKKNEDTL